MSKPQNVSSVEDTTWVENLKPTDNQKKKKKKKKKKLCNVYMINVIQSNALENIRFHTNAQECVCYQNILIVFYFFYTFYLNFLTFKNDFTL